MWLEPEMKIHAPEIGRAWYNTAPLAMHKLRNGRTDRMKTLL